MRRVILSQEEILARVIPEPNSGCWLWTGYVDGRGYGAIGTERKLVRAHRASYEVFVGPIPSGLTIDHLCRVRCCVNPAHLEPVPFKTNVLRGESFAAVYARSDLCKNGHPFSGDNLRETAGRRFCRACWRMRSAAYKAKGQPLLAEVFQ